MIPDPAIAGWTGFAAGIVRGAARESARGSG